MSTVIVTSPPLSESVKEMAQLYLPSSVVFVWEQGDLDSLSAIRSVLLSGDFSLCISFYNDYIFEPEEIEKIGCVVNIHPALPQLRGRGYDIIPLLDNHTIHGATLHFVTESIDAGQIIDVVSQPIPQGITYQELRSRNQMLSLLMLDRLFRICQRNGFLDLPGVLGQLASTSTHVWQGDFMNSARLAAMLSDLRRSHPRHPVLQQLPDVFLAGTPPISFQPRTVLSA